MCGAARPEGRMHSASSSHARALHPRPIVRRLPPSRQPIKCSVMESEQAPAKKSNNDASRRAAELVGGCDRLSARIANFQGRKPHVEGIIKLQRAVQREREVALGLQSSPDPARGIQGLENNPGVSRWSSSAQTGPPTSLPSVNDSPRGRPRSTRN